jgi:hypothetical protein
MARKNDGRPGIEVGLACPACGVPSRPDAQELAAVVRDARQWSGWFARRKAAVALLWARLAAWRPVHSRRRTV